MTAKILPLPFGRRAPKVGDPVVFVASDQRGTVERILPNKIGKPALAVVRVMGGFGARLAPFNEIRLVPAGRAKP